MKNGMRDMVTKRLLRRSGKDGKGVYIVYFRNQLKWDRMSYPYFENSTKIKIENPNQWDHKTGFLKGNTEPVRKINKQIRDKLKSVEEHWDKARVNLTTLHFTKFKAEINALMGGRFAEVYDENTSVQISKVFDLHVQNGKKKGGEFAPERISRYDLIRDDTVEFCKQNYGTEKVGVDKLDDQYYYKFRSYLQKKRGLKQTTLQGYMKVLEAAVTSEWSRGKYTTIYPFTGCETEGGKSTRTALSFDDLKKIELLPDELLGEVLALVRDVFLFQCYTGISYCDVKALNKDYIQVLEDEEYLVKDREKNVNNANSNFFSVPLTKDVKSLL